MSLAELTRVLEELEEVVDGLLGRLEKTSDTKEGQASSARERKTAIHLPDTDPGGEEAAQLIRRAIKRLTSLY